MTYINFIFNNEMIHKAQGPIIPRIGEYVKLKAPSIGSLKTYEVTHVVHMYFELEPYQSSISIFVKLKD